MREQILHFKVYSKYFYSKLDNLGKQAYDQLLNGWLNYEENVKIIGLNGKVDFSKLVHYIHDDNPELFYVDYSQIMFSVSTFDTVVMMKLRYSVKECEYLKSRIFDVVKHVEELCSKSNDRERCIHDYLVSHVKYSDDKDADDGHCIKGPLLDGTGVCEGYARSFKLLCDAVRVPCMVITGTGCNSKGETESHAWNIIRKNRANYHVDVTWDRANYDISGIPLYYNVSDEYISKNHEWEKNIWPVCSCNKETESYMMSAVGKKSLGAIFQKMYSQKKSVFVVRVNKKFKSLDEVVEVFGKVLHENNIAVSSKFSYDAALDCVTVWFEY